MIYIVLILLQQIYTTLLYENRRYANSDIGLHFFTMRVINYWNHIPDVVVSYKSLSIFKMKLDKFMTEKMKFKYIVFQIKHGSFTLLFLILSV